MSTPIYRAPLRDEWAPSAPEYNFRPEPEDAEPYAWIEAPPGWMLVGEPLLLVKRIDHSNFRSMTATEALFFALSRVEGFAVAGMTGEGNPMSLAIEVVRRGEPRQASVTTTRRSKGLPAPSRTKK